MYEGVRVVVQQEKGADPRRACRRLSSLPLSAARLFYDA